MGYNSIPKQKVAHIYNRFDIKFKIYFFRRQNRQFREESNWATGSTVGGAAKSSKFQIYMPSIVFVGYLLLRYWIVAHTSGLPIVKDGLPIEIRGLPMGYVESNWATGSTVGGAANSSNRKKVYFALYSRHWHRCLLSFTVKAAYGGGSWPRHTAVNVTMSTLLRIPENCHFYWQRSPAVAHEFL